MRTTGAAHAEAWPSRAMPARNGKARVRWPFCENAPDLPTNHAKVHGTISTDNYLTNITLPFSFFTMTKSLTLARAPARRRWHRAATPATPDPHSPI